MYDGCSKEERESSKWDGEKSELIRDAMREWGMKHTLVWLCSDGIVPENLYIYILRCENKNKKWNVSFEVNSEVRYWVLTSNNT